jgi:hypothetical protein
MLIKSSAVSSGSTSPPSRGRRRRRWFRRSKRSWQRAVDRGFHSARRGRGAGADRAQQRRRPPGYRGGSRQRFCPVTPQREEEAAVVDQAIEEIGRNEAEEAIG